MTARTITPDSARPMALGTLVLAAAIGLVGAVALASSLDGSTPAAAQAQLGVTDDYGTRHLPARAAQPQLTTVDDHGTRHLPARAAWAQLSTADDYGTRHQIAPVQLGEADDYGTRNGGPSRFGPPGR